MLDSAVQRVVRRFLARSVQSDAAFQPPLWMVNAVDEGKMPVEALNVWKAVVQKIASEGHWDPKRGYGAALSYWRNKCPKNGIAIPPEFLKGGGGEGAQGKWRAKSGDEVEAWVKETLKSAGLLDETQKTAHDWEMEITSLERLVGEAQGKIETHTKGIAEGNRVNQRVKWLESAKKELEAQSKALADAKKALDEFNATAARYATHKTPIIEFEKEFQFMLLLAAKDFEKKDVLASVASALKRFEDGLAIPDAGPADDPAKYQGYKSAGLGDMLTKAWSFLVGAWHKFTNWLEDFVSDTKKIDGLLTEAGAS